MVRRLTFATAVVAIACSLPTAARAQQPIGRPTVSPYLSLTQNQSRTPAINYYNQVRPQFAFRGAIQQLQQGERPEDQNTFDPVRGPDALPATGHNTGFLTHSVYFGTLGGRGQGTNRNTSASRPRPATRGKAVSTGY